MNVLTFKDVPDMINDVRRPVLYYYKVTCINSAVDITDIYKAANAFLFIKMLSNIDWWTASYFFDRDINMGATYQTFLQQGFTLQHLFPLVEKWIICSVMCFWLERGRKVAHEP